MFVFHLLSTLQVNDLTDGLPDLQNMNAPTVIVEMPSSRDQEIKTPPYVDSTNERKTPLDLAIENNFEKCIHVLRDNGALVFYELQHLAATIIQVCCNFYTVSTLLFQSAFRGHLVRTQLSRQRNSRVRTVSQC